MAHSRSIALVVKPVHDGWASIYSGHCHGKLRQIKPEQIGRSD
jgi:hypothetical protein